MEQTKLRQILLDQQEAFFSSEEKLVERDVSLEFFLKGNEAVIVSGIRRCGKSTLLKLIAQRLEGKKLFLNFDDIRLTGFSLDNFHDVENLAFELLGTGDVIYFFDEIQNVPGWERWVNNLYARGRKVFITGSNSKLLSSEISTFLTGRNKVLWLHPLSFREFLRLKASEDVKRAVLEETEGFLKLTTDQRNQLFRLFLQYFETGGFPLIDRNDDIELSRQYFEDILNKDVFARYQIRHVKEVKDLALYLFSNTGRTYSYSTLKQITGIKSLSTLKNYVDYLKNVFLLYTINRFDYSVKKQKVSSARPYIADTSFFRTVAFNFSENKGKRLENLVFLQLLRQGKEIYYHHDKKECDFVVKEGLKVISAIQVSYELSDPRTRKREIDGLLEAMRKYKLQEGLILTLEGSGELKEKGITIRPVWKWLLETQS